MAPRATKKEPKFGSSPRTDAFAETLDTTASGPAAIVDRTGERAIDLRAELLDRHRREVNISRALLVEAVKGRHFEGTKLAKITIETVKLIQDCERRAWGLDALEVTKLTTEQLRAIAGVRAAPR